jgi:hypothetical protein
MLYLLTDNHTPLSHAERFFAYLLAWPLIELEHLGGVADLAVPDRPVWPAWLSLWIYYYLLVALWQRRSRKQ